MALSSEHKPMPPMLRALYGEVPAECALCGATFSRDRLWPVRVASRMIAERHKPELRHISSLGDCWLCSWCRMRTFNERSSKT